MNVFELLFLLLALFLSYRLGVYFVGRVGWVGVVPGIILGFGSMVALLYMLRKLLARRRSGAGRNE